MDSVKIGTRLVGDGQPCFIVAEIGINHNGDLDLARKLICGRHCCAAVTQSSSRSGRSSVVYTAEELAKPRENPFGPTNGDLKRGLEFGEDDYGAIDRVLQACSTSSGSPRAGTRLRSTSLSGSTLPATRSRRRR